MKRFAILLATVIFSLSLTMPVMAQSLDKTAKSKSLPMQMYHVAMVKKGPNWKSQGTQKGIDARMQAIENIKKGAKMGLIVTAGLVNDETDVEFIVIMKVETKYEALEILESSPGYKSGQYAADVYSMFAPKGLVVSPTK